MPNVRDITGDFTPPAEEPIWTREETKSWTNLVCCFHMYQL